MTARAMHHARLLLREQSGIATREVIDVNRHEVRAERIVACEQLHGRNSAAITHVAIVVLKPVMQFAARVLEHLELRSRLSHVCGDAEFLFARDARSHAEQVGCGGIWRVR